MNEFVQASSNIYTTGEWKVLTKFRRELRASPMKLLRVSPIVSKLTSKYNIKYSLLVI